MNQHARRSFLAVVQTWLVCAAVLLAASSAALVVHQARAEEIMVRLKSGRTFRAAIDQRTSESELWLRFEGESMVIQRPVAWDRVEQATVAGEELDAAAFRQRALKLRSAAPVAYIAPHDPINGGPIPNPTSPESSDIPGHVTSIQADAWLANLDADVDADGLLVRIAPTSTGLITNALDGSAEIELVAARSGGLPQRIGRWTELLDATSATDDGGWELRLPFQGVHPEFDLDFGPRSLVKINVNLPGHGVFHATLTDIRIRPYSSERDRLQRQTGQRFLPDERTGR